MFFQILEAIRDLIIGILPKGLFSKFFGGEFAFICHPLDARDSVRKYPFTRGISERFFELWTRHFWPVIGAQIIGPKKVTGELSKGWAVICPLTPTTMIQNPEFARKMILRTVRLCEKIELKLVALGGYNSIITRDGEDLLGKTFLSVTTGNTYSAVLVIENLKKAARELSLDLKTAKVAIIGAAGSVGYACSHLIPPLVEGVWLMDINRKAVKELFMKVSQSCSNMQVFDTLDMIKEMDVVITATSTPRAIIHEENVRSGMIFIDASQPKNISEELAKKRDDILIIDSGIAKIPHLHCQMEMGPYKDEVYACLGEALALVCQGRISSFSIGKVRPENVEELSTALLRVGFEVPQFRNAGGYISEDKMRRFQEKYLPTGLLQKS